MTRPVRLGRDTWHPAPKIFRHAQFQTCLVLAVVLGVGCGTNSAGRQDGGTLSGRLIVHTGQVVSDGGSASDVRSVYVLLGDGTRFALAADDRGDVTFSDPEITGAQVVTSVVTTWGGSVSAKSVLGVTSSEIWLSSQSPSQPVELEGTISGVVSGFDAGDIVEVYSVGPYFGGAAAASDGSFVLSPFGPGPGETALFAEELDGNSELVRVGLKTGIYLDGGSVAVQDLALDRALDHPVTISVDGGDAYGGIARATLEYDLGGETLFAQTSSGPSPITISGVPLIGSFSPTAQKIGGAAGDQDLLPNGTAESWLVTDGGAAAGVELLSPLALIQPGIGYSGSSPQVSRNGLALRWRSDSSAQAVSIDLRGAQLEWKIVAPQDISQFSLFPLPSVSSQVATFQAEEVRVIGTSYFYSGIGGYEGYLASDVSTRAAGSMNRKDTTVRGYITLTD